GQGSDNKQPHKTNSTENIGDKVKDNGKRNFHNKSLAGKLFDYTIGTAFAAAAVSIMGPMALIGPATAILGDYIVNRKRGKKLSSRQIRDNMVIGSIMSIPSIFGFNLMNEYINIKTWAGKIARAIVQTGPFYLAIAPPWYLVDYIVRPYKNKSLKNLSEKHLKPFFFRNWRDGLATFTVPNQLAANYLPPITHYPISSGLGLLYRGTVGQRLLKAEDPYDLKGNGNGSNIKKKGRGSSNYIPEKSYST
ncbi:unnamed protein product, partial [marine sediment metagenome]